MLPLNCPTLPVCLPACLSNRGEGEKLSRKNGELEAATRRVRAQLRESEADRYVALVPPPVLLVLPVRLVVLLRARLQAQLPDSEADRCEGACWYSCCRYCSRYCSYN